jgi:hypothetical protein
MLEPGTLGNLCMSDAKLLAAVPHRFPQFEAEPGRLVCVTGAGRAP